MWIVFFSAKNRLIIDRFYGLTSVGSGGGGGGCGSGLFQGPAVALLGRRVGRRRRHERQAPARLERERLVHDGRAARVAAARDDLVVDRLGGRGGQQTVAARARHQRRADGRLPVVVRVVGVAAHRRDRAGRHGQLEPVQALRPVTRRRERAGQAVGQRETVRAAARTRPPPGRGPFAGRRARRSVVRGRAAGGRGGRRPLPFACGVWDGRGGRPPQPYVGQPFGQRRHDAQPVAGAAAERAVFHADLVDEPVDQPGRALVVRT